MKQHFDDYMTRQDLFSDLTMIGVDVKAFLEAFGEISTEELCKLTVHFRLACAQYDRKKELEILGQTRTSEASELPT